MLDLDRLLRFAVEQGASDVHVKVGARPRLRVDGRLREAPVRHRRAGRHRARAAAVHPAARADGVPEHERGRLHVRHHRARPLPRERVPPARLGRARVPPRAARHPRLRRARAAARRRDARRAAARARARVRSRRLGQDRDARRDGRPREHAPRSVTSSRSRTRSRCCTPTSVSIVDQREVGTDTPSVQSALVHALRQDPDVIMVSEIARRRRGVGGAASGRDRPPRAVGLSTRQRDRHRRTVHRPVPAAPTAPGAGVAGRRRCAASSRNGCSPRAGGRGRVPAVEVLVVNARVRGTDRRPDRAARARRRDGRRRPLRHADASTRASCTSTAAGWSTRADALAHADEPR